MPIPGYFGSLSVHRVTRTLALTVEAGHSYMPFARKSCDRDWIWVVDTGASAAEDIALWEKGDAYMLSYRVRSRDSATLKVVSGYPPAETCSGE